MPARPLSSSPRSASSCPSSTYTSTPFMGLSQIIRCWVGLSWLGLTLALARQRCSKGIPLPPCPLPLQHSVSATSNVAYKLPILKWWQVYGKKMKEEQQQRREWGRSTQRQKGNSSENAIHGGLMSRGFHSPLPTVCTRNLSHANCIKYLPPLPWEVKMVSCLGHRQWLPTVHVHGSLCN